MRGEEQGEEWQTLQSELASKKIAICHQNDCLELKYYWCGKGYEIFMVYNLILNVEGMKNQHFCF